MRIVSTVVACSIDECWRAFTEPANATTWVPGLRAAVVIEEGPDGLPREVQFEFAGDLLYSLEYTYDVTAKVVRWEPRAGENGAVRGFARFDAASEAEATLVTYALEHEAGRKAAERAIDDSRLLVDAFARMMHER